MEYKKYGQVWVLRLDAGEEVLTALGDLARREDIAFATVQGIGAAGRLQAGALNPTDKQYYAVEAEGMFEIANLSGNITRKDGEPYLHIHITAADPCEGRVIAGHLSQAIISVTAEIFVTEVAGAMGRKFSERAGLNLLDFR